LTQPWHVTTAKAYAQLQWRAKLCQTDHANAAFRPTLTSDNGTPTIGHNALPAGLAGRPRLKGRIPSPLRSKPLRRGLTDLTSATSMAGSQLEQTPYLPHCFSFRVHLDPVSKSSPVAILHARLVAKRSGCPASGRPGLVRTTAGARRFPIPLRADWRCHAQLAEVLLAAGKVAESVAALRQSLACDSTRPQVWQNLAASLLELGELPGAIEAAQQALKLQPGYPAALNVLGVAQATAGEHRSAVTALREAVALRTDYFEAQQNLANSLELLGETAEAAEVYRQLLQYPPHAAAAEFALAALGAGPPPPQPPAGYVARFFDAYANAYDAHLREQLDYQAPRLVAEAIEAAGWPQAARVVDLGCGTGLMGARLQSHAAFSDGRRCSRHKCFAARLQLALQSIGRARSGRVSLRIG